MSPDELWIENISKVSDPSEACRVIVEHENYLGFDPYYRDIREALVQMCERCGAVGLDSK